MTTLPDGQCLTNLTREDSIGLAFVVEAGILSATSLAVLAVLLIRNILRYRKYADAYKWSLVEQPSDVYVLSLFVADVLQSIGASMSAKWVNDGMVLPGHYCTAQGVIQQLGETSVGLATMLIAIHTFLSVWVRKDHSVRTAVIVVFVSWTFMGLFVGISAGIHHNYDEPSPFWCWVGPNYGGERIAGEYFWLWLALFVAILVYVPLFMWHQGYISIDEKIWWKVKWYTRYHEDGRDTRNRPLASSLKLLAYPVAYSIVVLPVSVARWITFGDNTGCAVDPRMPRAATFATVFLHDCFGFVNVLLLLTTRQTLLLFDDPKNQKRERPRKDGAVLEDWDDERRINGNGNANANGKDSPAPSSRDSFLGVRTAARSGGIGNTNSNAEARSSYNEEDDADARINILMQEIRPSAPSSPYSTSDVTRRAASLDSGRDVLGVMTREGMRQNSGGSGHAPSIVPSSPSTMHERRPGSGTSSNDNAYGERAQPPHRDVRTGSVSSRQQSQQQQHSSSHLLARLHSKTSSGGSGNYPPAEEYTDEDIERRFMDLTSSNTNTNTNAGSRVPVPKYDL
ncbi:hypothetical protein SCHPADRAFT_993599 [Schizopora paradoxa]|uniref:Uncharacterized protein n=1 Tax=Schizopora paradoxa TaxID=27342 RepID=A0A0H2S9G4_9AGAM|nr:hypothetical protein SCHPADRAFT_993599 [Schizopora paradoxa]